MTRVRPHLLALCVLSWLLGVAQARPFEDNRAQRVADAITEMDLAHAEQLLSESAEDSPVFGYERARLAVYSGACDRALAILSSPVLSETREGSQLSELAKSCARATAAGLVVEDAQRGIWLRLQDDEDRVLAPFLFDVAAQARDAISKEIGVDLPRPLRIDLVRDLFSLSAVSGLPLDAAETTGTLAVARWGRVTMLSPRAMTQGYPWQDTLAHEITHLLVTRATRDFAPLWLQEGLAKRFETRWREPRPFDQASWADAQARAAARGGRSVGIDKLGPSIAMLPTPEAAGTAFAEVTSFVHFFIEQNGEAGLRLLLGDLRGNGVAGADAALRSVTGYQLADWNRRWQTQLVAGNDAPLTDEKFAPPAPRSARDLARRARLAEILMGAARPASAAVELAPMLEAAPHSARLRAELARALFASHDDSGVGKVLGARTEIDNLYGPWFGLHGRVSKAQGDFTAADSDFTLGLAATPLSEDVACEGFSVQTDAVGDKPSLPERPAWRDLCEATRRLPRD
ncbi:MAG TPA: hypothetical protein VGI10_27915 [Polyangiaceae bacterium]|jgi:hypothetical protein